MQRIAGRIASNSISKTEAYQSWLKWFDGKEVVTKGLLDEVGKSFNSVTSRSDSDRTGLLADADA